jgi:cleavage and polyadenylation specificity factor subunit 1
MELTEFPEEPGSSNDTDVSGDELSKRMFVAVGTGVLDHNGEDVASRGRAILLELKRTNSSAKAAGRQVVELSFCYEKEIFHGAVTSLVCLSSEGKNRLLIGAGADSKLCQLLSKTVLQSSFSHTSR